jgi:glutathione S-transferase
VRLYHAPTSPFARKVRVTLIETGQAEQVTLSAVAGTPMDPGTMPLAQNPLGKIPVLERDGAPSLYDSRVICRFLDAQAGGRLYPDGERGWQALTLEAMADGILDAAVLMVYEGRVRAPEHQLPEWVEGQWAKVTRALDTIEARWMAHLAGPLDCGQIALGCALGYLDFRHGARDWRKGRTALAAWEARFAERPAMVATRPPAA